MLANPQKVEKYKVSYDEDTLTKAYLAYVGMLEWINNTEVHYNESEFINKIILRCFCDFGRRLKLITRVKSYNAMGLTTLTQDRQFVSDVEELEGVWD